MNDTFGLVALVALGTKLVDFLKFARARDTNAVFTQAVVWLVGVGLTFLASASNLAQHLKVYGTELQDLNAAAKVLVGAGLLSIGSVLYDHRQGNDNTDSAKVPPLLGSGTDSENSV